MLRDGGDGRLAPRNLPPITPLSPKPVRAGNHVIDEAERSLHDALCVLSQAVKDKRVVYGGGWPEMQLARVVDDLAARTPGKKSLAMAAFARALRQLPTTICDNAGLDSAEVVSRMRAAHAEAPDTTEAGIDIVTGSVGSMKEVRRGARRVSGDEVAE
jgi:T-complex protein 1 subunit beta